MTNEFEDFIAELRSELAEGASISDDLYEEGNVVLKYGEYVIREGGMETLLDGNPISDEIIGFYLQYLSDEIYPEKSTKVKIVRSEAVDILQMLCLTQGKLENLLGGAVKDYNFIVFPMNKSRDAFEALVSGENPHWSLLIYCRLENVIAHFDSSYGTNFTPAEKFARQLSKAIPARPLFTSRGCNAQQSTDDSGIHLLSNVEKIVEHVLRYKLINGVQTAKPEYATGLREKITGLIQTKAKTFDSNSNSPTSS